MKREEIGALLAAKSDAWRRRDIGALVACYCSDASIESPMFKNVKGLEQIEATFRELYTAFPDWEYRSDEILFSQDEQVAELFTVRATHVKAIRAIPQQPSRYTFELHGVLLMRFRDNRICYERRIYDLPALLQALERARLERDLIVAAEIQNVLLPRTEHVGSHFEAVGASLPCRAIGGDFFEYVDLADGAFGVALGDVAGKGMAAALLASMTQGVLSAEASHDSDPALTCARVNHALCRRAIEGRFVTAFYGVLARSGTLTYCNAGHNPPLLATDRGIERLDTSGSILGGFADAQFDRGSRRLEVGDVLLLYTDGLSEATNSGGEEFGEARLAGCLAANQLLPSRALLDCVFTTLRRFCDGTVYSDDVTAVVVRYTGDERSR